MNILGQEHVSNLMTTEIISLSPSSSLKEANETLSKHSIRHILIIKDEQLVGILSRNDLEKFSLTTKSAYNDIQSKLSETLTVEQLMTKSVHTVQHDDTIKEAAELLSLSSYHALPVMKGQQVVGIVTSTDMILYLLKSCI